MTQQARTPNVFELTGDGVHILYQAIHFIDTPTLPELSYQDGQYDLTFHKDEIRTQQSELGTLVSVSLQRTVDTGATVLTLFLPAINLGGGTEANFETLAIISRTLGLIPGEGAREIYEAVLHLQGVARLVPLL